LIIVILLDRELIGVPDDRATDAGRRAGEAGIAAAPGGVLTQVNERAALSWKDAGAVHLFRGH
jgi:hypothetical protein